MPHPAGSEGSPELFVFQFVLRGSGSVKVGPFQVPLNAQIDAFDVHVPTTDDLHAETTEMAEPTSVNPQVTD